MNIKFDNIQNKANNDKFDKIRAKKREKLL